MSAEDQVQKILRKTASRKAVWKQVEAAALEAFTAVKHEAKRRGVKGLKWIPSKTLSFGLIVASGKPEIFSIDRKGILTYPKMRHFIDEYEGYPKLNEKDIDAIKKAVIKELMTQLNEYCASQGL